jgi:hypothetical protein
MRSVESRQNHATGARDGAGLNDAMPLRQIAFAAKPQVFRRFHLRHLQEVAEHLEPVTPRQPRQLDEVLRDQRRGLVGPAIL